MSVPRPSFSFLNRPGMALLFALLFSLVWIVAQVTCSDIWLLLAVGFGLLSLILGLPGGLYLLRTKMDLQEDHPAFWALLMLPATLILVRGLAGALNQQERMTRTTNMQKIGTAMHEYADDHQSRFPPAALRDKDGKALLSWRVLLLPYLGEQGLYRRFQLDEPWDSPSNLALLENMPKVYQSAYPDVTSPFTTRLQVLVGPGTPFEVVKGPHLPKDFPDGSSQTILFIEARQAVPWTQPADIDYSPDRPLPLFGREPDQFRWWFHRGLSVHYFHCCFGDGSVWTISTRVKEPWLRRAITRNDGLELGKQY
jgi:hypothetical protein